MGKDLGCDVVTVGGCDIPTSSLRGLGDDCSNKASKPPDKSSPSLGIASKTFLDECLINRGAVRLSLIVQVSRALSHGDVSAEILQFMNYTPCFSQQPSRVCAEETNSARLETLVEVLIPVCPMENSLTGGSVLPTIPLLRRPSISINFAHSVRFDFLAHLEFSNTDAGSRTRVGLRSF